MTDKAEKHTAIRYGNRYLYRGCWIKKVGKHCWVVYGPPTGLLEKDDASLGGDTLKSAKESIDYAYKRQERKRQHG